jgi:microcystin degradation protein MlrC
MSAPLHPDRVRIAIAGVSSESSTFSLARTGRDRFQVLRGEELLAQYRFPERLGVVVDGVDWVPIMRAAGQSGGPIDPEMYDGFVDEILAGLAAHAPYDGVYLDMHGAMHVDGRDDAEERFVERVREIVGPHAVIAMSMDPHGNLSRTLATQVDLAAAHRHSPHTDAALTVERTVTHLLDAVRTGRVPHKAWVRVPVLLPGERSGTFVEPGQSLFGRLLPAIERHGVLDANMWVGYAWADEARNSAAVLVTGFDPDAVRACAEELAQAYWQVREEFRITSPQSGTLDEAFDFVLTGPATPVFVSDGGDNSTGGADGDGTTVLARVLERDDLAAAGTRVLVAGIYDPASVARAAELGECAVLQHPIGAWISASVHPPVPGPWRIERLIEGRYGEGIVAALLSRGPVHVTVQTRRAVFTTPDDAAYYPRQIPGQAWFDVSGYDAVVVKNGYLFPGQVEAAGDEFMALTPGGTDLDFDRLPLPNWSRPMFPLDRDFTPDLSAVLLPRWSADVSPTGIRSTTHDTPEESA